MERALTGEDAVPAASTRTVTIPVPEVGEIILRYGEAYGARSAAVVAAAAVPAPAGDSTQVRLQVALLEARLPEVIRQIVREELSRAAPLQPVVVAPGAPASQVVAPARQGEPFLQDGRIHALIPFGGGQPSSPVQVLVGMRGDLGRINGPIPLTVLAEVSVGLGEGRKTVRAALNGRIGWNLGGASNLTPYGQAGVSITNHRMLSLDPAYGATFDAFRSSSRGPYRLFVEHRGVALFKESHLLFGVSIGR